MADINLIIQATDKATPTLKRVNKQVDKFSRKANKATKSGGAMGKMMKMAGAAVLAMGMARIASSTVQVIAQFDSLKAMLKTVTGSTEGALVAFEQIKKFTAETPFQLAEVTNAFSILKRNGLDTTSESLTAFGNIAAANGKTFEQFAEALGDAVTGEFERMKEFGIKVKKEGDQMVAFMGSTQIGVSDSAEGIIEVFKKLGEEGGRYATGLADQAATIGGKWSNLQDAMAETAYNIGEGGLKTVLMEVTAGLTDMFKGSGNLATMLGAGLGAAIKTAMMWFSSMGAMFQIVYNGIKDLAVSLGNKIKEPIHNAKNKIGEWLGVILEKFHNSFAGIKKVVKLAINTVINTLIVFYKNAKIIFQNLPEIMRKTWSEISRVVPLFGKTLIAQVKEIGKVVFHNLGVVWENLPEIIKWGFKAVIAVIVQGGPMLIKQYINIWTTLFDNIGVVLKNIPMLFNSSWTNILSNVVGFGKDIIAKVKNIGVDIFSGIGDFISDIPQIFTDVFKKIGTKMFEFGKSVVTQVKNIGSAIKLAFQSLNPFSDVTIEDAWNEIRSTFVAGVDKIKLKWGLEDKTTEDLWEEVPHIPMKVKWETLMSQMTTFKNQFGAIEFDPFPTLTGLKSLSDIDNYFKGKKWTLDMGLDEVLLSAEAVRDIMETDRVGEFLSEEWVQNAIAGLKKMSTLAKDISGPGLIKKFMSEYDRLIAQGIDKQKALALAIAATEEAQADLNETLKDPDVKEMISENTAAIIDGHMAMNQAEDGWTDFQLKAKDALAAIKSGLEGLAGNMTDVFYDMFTGVTSVMDGLKSMANMVFQLIAKALIKYYVVQPIINALTGGLGGWFGKLFGLAQGGMAIGGRPTIVGENGPELMVPKGNTRVYSNAQSRNLMGDGSSGEPIIINFNVSSIDSRSGTQFIMQNQDAINGMVQEAFNRRGRAGPFG